MTAGARSRRGLAFRPSRGVASGGAAGFGLLAVAALLLGVGCTERLLDVDDPVLEVVALSGDGQMTGSGGDLHAPLAVLVRRVRTGEPVADVAVRWSVVAGDGAALSAETTETDAAGRATVEVTLGATVGAYAIEADFEGRSGSAALFEAFAVLPPEITGLPAAAVVAGETIRIEGRHFHPDPATNTVLFSGFRGEVTAAGEEELSVRVPACLPSRQIQLTVALGPSVRGEAVPLDVVGASGGEGMAVGDAVVLDDADGPACLHLPPGESARYLAVPHSGASLQGGRHPYRLLGLAGAGTVAMRLSGDGAPLPNARHGDDVPHLRDAAQDPAHPDAPQARWDRDLREHEKRLLPLRAGERTVAPRAPALAVHPPDPGDRREFSVLARDGSFDTVTAEVRHVGTRVLVYEDVDAPAGGLSDEDFAGFAAAFDETIFPSVTGVFGDPSDLDGNGRIIVLFTPQVNRLTLPGSGGFVGGFFFGLDLLPDREGSNGGEVFYTLVPDPEGAFGDPRSRDTVLRAAPGILAHEFQHMVHFNERVLVRGAPTTEALWLSEGLAQMAEDVVSEVFASRGDAEVAERYRSGNLGRGRRYIQDPRAVSLVPTTGGGTVEERGAGWLFLRYLRGQEGKGNELLSALTRTTRTGISNVRAETGRDWAELVASWSAALYLDGLDVPSDPRFHFPDLSVREALATTSGSYPLLLRHRGPADFSDPGTLRSSASVHYVVQPGSGGTAIALVGDDGLPTAPAGRLRLVVVRVQ